jgi:hypothetical protein
MPVNLWSFGLVTPPDSRCTLVLRGLLPCEVMPKPTLLPIIAALHEAVEQHITSECCVQIWVRLHFSTWLRIQLSSHRAAVVSLSTEPSEVP